MNLYRIYLGSPYNEKKAIRIVQDFFEGFTLYHTTGCWKGTRELTLVFEIISNDEKTINLLAGCLRSRFEQHYVMIICQPVNVKFV